MCRRTWLDAEEGGEQEPAILATRDQTGIYHIGGLRTQVASERWEPGRRILKPLLVEVVALRQLLRP